MASSSGVSATPQKKIVFSRTRQIAAASSKNPSTPGGTPASPQTPLGRSVSSLYGSPGGSAFRVEDENLLIFEIGSRVIRAGFAGESCPRCQISYHPDQLRRVGDYRQYAPEYRRRRQKLGQDWTDMYELWRPEVRDQDLSLLGDRLERLVREIESTYLLLDATRPRKVALVLSSQLPRPLLEIAVNSLFGALQCTHVTLLPSNTMAVVAAGLRSALVINIGWAETSVSAIFEYREVSQRQTIRGSKMIVEAYAKMMQEMEMSRELTVEETEDVIIRLGWCRKMNEETSKENEGCKQAILLPDFTTEIAFDALAQPPEEILFGKGDGDDHNLSIANVAYNVLLHLSLDTRNSCLSRIIITGGASQIPGLKRRFLQELEHLIAQRAWDFVENYGSVQTKSSAKSKITVRNANSSSTIRQLDAESTSGSDTKVPPAASEEASYDSSTRSAHLISQETDNVMERIMQRRQKRAEDTSHTDPPSGTIRAVSSLGAWAGASILSNLRIRGSVEIERDRFLAGGLIAGVSKKEGIALAQRQSIAGPPPNLRQVSLDKSHTLGIWA